MSGMSSAHAKQSSKFKNKFEAMRKNGVLSVRKLKRIAKHNHFHELKALHPPKVARGTARRLRRQVTVE